MMSRAKHSDVVIPVLTPALPDAPSHHDFASALIARWTAEDSVKPIAAEGLIYRFQDGLWLPTRQADAEVAIGAIYGGQSKCQRKSDFGMIARHAYDMLNTGPDTFDGAPPGVATPCGFHYIRAGEIVTEPLKPEHRQKFHLPVDPEPGVPELFMQHVYRCFEGDDTEGQSKLLQQVFGATLFGLAAQLHKAALFYGPAATGKSTSLNMLTELVPPAFQSATSPFLWDGEYYIASLAGKRLNMVGELPGEKLIPDAPFKRVLGRDVLTGRHPNHRPFEFRNTATHVFNSNTLPQTRDKGTAFFRRWLVLRFRNPLSAEAMVPDFERQIIEQELPRILNWAMRGALDVVKSGFTESSTHREVLRKWKLQADSALAFLADDAAVVPDPHIKWDLAPLRSQVYATYKDWAHDSEKRPLGKVRFFESIDGANIFECGTRVEIAKYQGEYRVHGIRLIWNQ